MCARSGSSVKHVLHADYAWLETYVVSKVSGIASRQPVRVGVRTKGEAPLVFVGIYSARGNFDKRNSVRETWCRSESSPNLS
eukprot:4491403-Amphidinium_carterae.3